MTIRQKPINDPYMLKYYPEARFGGFADIDGTILFYLRVHSLLTPESVVLDVGCGRGEYKADNVETRKKVRILKGKVLKVIGIDTDSYAASNPFIDEFRPITGATWPIEDQSVDLIVCDWVLEHIKNPSEFFTELNRVLKPDGYLCLRTSNVLGYVGVFSKLIPNRFHRSFLRKLQRKRKEQDIFPTFYNANSISVVKRLLKKHGFCGIVYGFESTPAYLKFSDWIFRLGLVWQRFAPGLLRNTLFVFAKKLS